MAALATAFVRILGDTKGLAPSVVAGSQTAGATAGKAGAKGFSGAFLGGLKGIAAPLAAIFGAQAIAGFTKDAIGQASDLRESINAVNVVFGDAAAGILKLSKNAATGVGLSRAEFNSLSVQFSAFAKTIAGKGGDVTGTIDGITKRAADFASVMNLDVAEAARLFQSGLAGETEPLRRFGIDLSAAAVKAHAYSEGIAESGDELTEAQKVQARYSLLLKQTNQTQGDFANTSGELANQQRILGARWDNLKATLGRALLPAVTAVVSAFNSLFEGGGKGSEIIDTLKAAFQGVWNIIKPLVPTVQQLGRQFIDIAGPAFQRIGELLTGTLIPSFTSFFETVRPILKFLINTVGGALLGAFEGAITFIEGALQIISGVLDVFVGIFTGDWSKAWNGVKQLAAGIWDAIRGAFQVFINIGILRLLRVGLGLIKALFSAGWGAVKGLTTSAWNSIRSFISGAWGRIRSAVSTGIGNVLSLVRGLPGRILSALGNLSKLLFSAGRAIIRGLINGIKSLAGKVGGTVKNIAGGAVSGVKNLLGIGSPSKVFAEIGMQSTEGLIQGLRRGARDLEGAARRTAGAMTAGANAAVPAGGGAMPRELAVRDFDGTLLGRMRVEAERVARLSERGQADRLAFSGAV